jgi:hypothetical protein
MKIDKDTKPAAVTLVGGGISVALGEYIPSALNGYLSAARAAAVKNKNMLRRMECGPYELVVAAPEKEERFNLEQFRNLF